MLKVKTPYKATLSDVPALAALEAAVFPPESYGPDVLNAAKFRYFLSKGNAVILVQKDDDAISGYILLLFRRGVKTARIYSVAVAPAAQGRGLGLALFTAAEAYCRAKGYSKIMLETRADNANLQKLCLGRGYKLLKKVPEYYHDGMAAHKFALALSRKGA